MTPRLALASLVAAALLGGCGASDDRQWMKVNERYTAEEFKRDHAECSRAGKLDEDCMRNRGWVTVTSHRIEPRNPTPERPSYGSQPLRR